MTAAFQIAITLRNLVAVGYRLPWGPPERDCLEKVMGIVMKKLVLLATALAMISGSALAADMAVKAVKAPPPAAFDPWDVAFGSAIMNDYIFRGITQSNHKPSVAAYFEPRYNVTKDVQLYVGVAGESISFPNRAAAEIDIYGGIRPTVGMFAFDFGVWGYLYPGGQCFGAQGTVRRRPTTAVFGQGIDFGVPGIGGLPINGNFAKRSASFYEVYAKVNITINDQFAVGLQRVLFAELPEPRRLGQLRLDHRQVDRAHRPPSAPAASACTSPVSSAGSGSARPMRSTAPPLQPRSAAVPERHSGAELQHLEYRHRLHLQGVHAGPPLLRHQPVEG